jgi:glucose-1-phosphate cytidylyltransferase
LEINSKGEVDSFVEKPMGDGVWINGGFFVLEPGIFKFLTDEADNIQWEKEPLSAIARENQLAAYKHYGFWKCMDALRDRVELEEMWKSGKAKWKLW